MANSVAPARAVSGHYSVAFPLDKRGDSVLLGEFDNMELPEDELQTQGYIHPNVKCASAQLAGAKDQDRVVLCESKDDSKGPHYFGVFDGHGLTATAADMCQETLHETIFRIDKEMKLDQAEIELGEDEDGSYVVPSDEAIVEGFHELDKKIQALHKDDPRTGTCAVILMLGKRIVPYTESERGSTDSSGSTHEVEGIAKVAWAGDSRCILVDEDSVHELTDDHRVDSHKGEQARIRATDNGTRPGLENSSFWAEQEKVAKDPAKLRRQSFLGRRRENGPLVLFAHSGGVSLQISRSIGDVLASRSAIPTPEIRTIKQNGAFKSGRFVMASDGVWDVMESEAVAKFIRKYKDPKLAASKLCSYAKNKRVYKGLYPDDISVVVVDVNSNQKGAEPGRKNSKCKVM